MSESKKRVQNAGQRKILISAVCLVCTVLLAAGAVFAWFTGGSMTVDNLIINTANIKIKSKLFQIVDFNFDGICDTEIDEDTGEESYRLVKDEAGNPIDYTKLGNVPLGGFFPGKTVSFLLEVENSGSEDCVLNLSADVDSEKTTPAEGSLAAMNELFSILFVKDGSDVPEVVRLTEPSNLIGKSLASVSKGEKVQFLFSVRMETLGFLKSHDASDGTNRFSGLEDLNDYLGNPDKPRVCVFSLIPELEQII